eukprot:6213058-Pleurochrysis_carterae.AAC.3
MRSSTTITQAQDVAVVQRVYFVKHARKCDLVPATLCATRRVTHFVSLMRRRCDLACTHRFVAHVSSVCRRCRAEQA